MRHASRQKIGDTYKALIVCEGCQKSVVFDYPSNQLSVVRLCKNCVKEFPAPDVVVSDFTNIKYFVKGFFRYVKRAI